jgi:hypothetical protein
MTSHDNPFEPDEEYRRKMEWKTAFPAVMAKCPCGARLEADSVLGLAMHEHFNHCWKLKQLQAGEVPFNWESDQPDDAAFLRSCNIKVDG